MAQVSFTRGKLEGLDNLDKKDGQISITMDEGRMYFDYLNDNGELIRKALYSGVLHIGEYEFNGTQDVTVPSYEGSVSD